MAATKQPNVGWLYYKNYYKGINWHDTKDSKDNKAIFDKANKEIFEQTLPKESPYAYNEFGDKIQYCDLTTTYPGLLIGTGYLHGTGLSGELKIGFYFDHTTGLPLIPGSSVKGLLRSMFPLQDKDKEQANQKIAFIKSLLPKGKQDIDIKKLEREIFGNANGDNESIKGNDIFHDAIIIKSEHPAHKGFPKACFLSDDYITPHKNPKSDGVADMFKNPIPIALLKILPKVTFRFQFVLQNHYYVKENGNYVEYTFLLTAQERLNFYKALLKTIGIGAKTNVGYGQFL
ncbi:MAG: type III-B CRISPR module RAMP protein Cmr6 [Chitinophagales bacterium]|nr:type III-B CRISPR module RAMP protein Cmr6 [Chitinophagales bacterium]